MKCLIVYESYHHGNTKQIAGAMAEELHADMVKATDAEYASLAGYDLIGFGSGIYAGRHHVSLLNFVRRMPHLDGTPAFIFSTAAFPEFKAVWHRSLARKLRRKGLVMCGDFSCKGLSTDGLCGVIGGVNKGRPDAGDLARAKRFAATLVASVPKPQRAPAGESPAQAH